LFGGRSWPRLPHPMVSAGGISSVNPSTPSKPLSFRILPPVLDRYVLREAILPFFLGFGLVTFLFVLNLLFELLDLLLSKDVPFPAVVQLFVYALGWVTALSFPCGVLVSALMTFGRMGQDNEITAMRSLGVNVARILRAPLAAAVVMAGLLVLFNNYVLPETNHRFANLRLAIHRKAPAAKIEPGIIIDAFDKYRLLVGNVNPKTGDLKDVKILDYTEGAVPTTIIAKRGHMEYLKGSSTLKLELMDGEIHEVPGQPAEGKYRRGHFEVHTLYLDNPGAELQKVDRTDRGDREKNIAMLRADIVMLEAQMTKQLASFDAKARNFGFPSFRTYMQAMQPPSPLQTLLGAVGLRRSAVPDSVLANPKAVAAMRMDVLEITSREKKIDSIKVEIQKKFSIPFACVVFVLLGGPLGIRTRKGGFANMAIAVGFFIIYYGFLIAGEQLADRRVVSPFMAMWLPNMVFGAVGIYLTASVVGLGPSRGMR